FCCRKSYMLDRNEIKRIINDCLDGKKESFSRIVEAFQKKIFNICFYFLGSYEDAKDATMEIFLKIFSNLSSFNLNLDFSSWVLTIAKNHLRDISRRKKIEREYITSQLKEKVEISDETPEKVLIEKTEKKILMDALLNLFENERTVIILKYYMEFSYEEIAKIMEIPRNTVATMIFRAKEKLRKILEKGDKNEVF
ncbi:MAG: RNA polymerase sigma factor, partial [Candidatus Aminicenantia bacterium]